MTRFGGPGEPAIDRIPGDAFDTSNGGLVQAFDAEGGDVVEGRATMLEAAVRRLGIRAEGLAASPAAVSTTPPPISSDVETGNAQFWEKPLLRLFMVSGPVGATTGHPGVESQILAAKGVTSGATNKRWRKDPATRDARSVWQLL